jgi:DNA-binding CsgD family transcriptional regulator
LNSPPPVNRVSDYIDYLYWEKNPHRSDFLLKQDIYHITFLEVINQNKIAVSLSLHRNKKHHDFSDLEINILRILSPFVKTSYNSLKATLPESLLTGEKKFTAREKQILILLITPYNNQELATYLGISINTLKTHIKNILRKVNCTSRFDLLSKIQNARFCK